MHAACILPYALQLEEAMGQQLDDHIVMLQSMGFSPYKKPFEDRLAKWDTMLNLVSAEHSNNYASNVLQT
jgi:hypothetical protein